MYVAGVPLAVSPAEHAALTVHVAPPTTAPHALTVYVAPFAFVTLSAAHWHVNIAGVSTPAAHASPVPDDTTYGAAHVGAQLVPASCVVPAPHVAAFATVGCVHAFASQIGAVPLNVPPLVHVYAAGDPTSVYPVMHVAATVHVPVTATVAAPHAAVVYVAPFAVASVSAVVH